jgi:hypothetical protein
MAPTSIKEKLAKFDKSIQLAYGHKWPGTSEIEESDILNTYEDKTEQPSAAEDSSLELHDYTHEEMDKQPLQGAPPP